jgi:hypothetical protein
MIGSYPPHPPLNNQLGRLILADVPTSHDTVVVSEGDCPIRKFLYSGVVGGKADTRTLSSGENPSGSKSQPCTAGPRARQWIAKRDQLVRRFRNQ